MRVAVLGAGQIGTAFAGLALERGHEVAVWGPEPDAPALEALAGGSEHPALGLALAAPVRASTEIEDAVDECELCVIAVASAGLADVAARAAPGLASGTPVLLLTKGLAVVDGAVRPLTESVAAAIQTAVVLGAGGPVKALDLVRRAPTLGIVAGPTLEAARGVARALATSWYRPQATDDLIGVELCAAVKNCYAIAYGIVTGGNGASNVRAFVHAVALQETAALCAAAGGRAETVAGPAGAGDLYVTCLEGRNLAFGRLLAEGRRPGEALERLEAATVEGLAALEPALALARSLGLGRAQLPLLFALDDVIEERTGELRLFELAGEAIPSDLKESSNLV